MSDFAVNGNNAMQTQVAEKLYRRVEIKGEVKYVEVPIGKSDTKTGSSTAAAKEVKPFDETTQKEILTARKFLDHEDKKVRKGAELTLVDLYQKAFIEEGKSEKEAKKLAKLALKEDQAALRFANRKVFMDKDEYKEAVKADKANKDDYEYLGKKTRQFVEANKDKFYVDGEFSSEEYKKFMKNIAAEDHQADLVELDKAAEEYDSTRKIMGKAAKEAGPDKEKDKTAAQRTLHVRKHAGIGAAAGSLIGAAVGYATGSVTQLKDVDHKHVNINDPNFDVDVDSNCNLEGKIDTRKSSAATGAIAGAIGGGISGTISGLMTMKKIKDEGEGEFTIREEIVDIVNGKTKKPEPKPDPVPPTPTPEDVECREEILDKPIYEEKPDLDYCEYAPKKGECWYDIARDKYGLQKADSKEIMSVVHKLKDYHGVKYSENVQPKVLKLYNNLEVGDKVYELDCDEKVNGTVGQYGKQNKYTGKFNPRTSEQQTGTEYTYNRYETRKGEERLVDTQKFTDQKQLEQYILENGCK